MEGRLVRSTLIELADRDQLDSSAKARLQESLEFMERLFHGLGFCLSEDGDLLSQWRGYADDGRGVAIGFRHDYLGELSNQTRTTNTSGFSIYKVEYEPSRHVAELEPTYRELRKLIDQGAFRSRGTLSLLDSRTPEEVAEDDKRIEQAYGSLTVQLLMLFPKLFELKSPAFREEREWRLVSVFSGTETEACLFRASGGRVIPYRSFDLRPLPMQAIQSVTLGPRHETPPQVVQSLLAQAGFADVLVTRSQATYR